MTICHVYADVGTRWPYGFPHHKRRGKGDDIMDMDAKRMLQSIHTNFVHLTHRVPMAQVEDFPKAMQCQVVGVPQEWVCLFHRLARVVVCYHDQHPPPPQA